MVYPGDTLYGYCDGYFGRDSYNDKIVLAVGDDWIVVRESYWDLEKHEEVKFPNLAHIEGGLAAKEDMINKWKVEKKEEEAW